MSVRVSSAGLDDAVKQLNLAWQQTRQDWHDVKSQQFEQQFLEKLPSVTSQARNMIEEIDALIRKVRKDCE